MTDTRDVVAKKRTYAMTVCVEIEAESERGFRAAVSDALHYIHVDTSTTAVMGPGVQFYSAQSLKSGRKAARVKKPAARRGAR